MGISIRIYLFPGDGSLKRVPRRVCDGLPFGEDAIPEYAGTRQRVAQVLVENEDRRPVRILDVRGHFWDFDAEGKIHEGLQERMVDFMGAPRSKRAAGKVVDLVPEIKKKRLHERHRWDLTNEDIDRIAGDIWSGIHGPAAQVMSVTGKAPMKPPLSQDARFAIGEIGDALERIKDRLRQLSEHSLKGLEFEAQRTATFEDADLWRGVAAAAKHQRDVRAAYRTGKGEWVVVIDAMRSEDPVTDVNAATAHERCATRDAAIAAGKRLMADKADWLGPDVRLEVSIVSALEWIDDDG